MSQALLKIDVVTLRRMAEPAGRAARDPGARLQQREAAAYIGFSARYLREKTAEGKISATKVGRNVLYTVAELDRYLRDNGEPRGPRPG